MLDLVFRPTVFSVSASIAWLGLLCTSVTTASPVSLAELRSGGGRTFRDAAPIEISGIVTYFDAKRDMAVLQDGTAALAIRGTSEQFSVGQEVDIRASAFAPFFPAIEHFPFRPDRVEQIGSLEVSTEHHRFYTDRLRGRIAAAAEGDYTFFLSADDSGELWLSTDAMPQHAQRIAMLAEWTEPHDYTRYPSQRSAPIHLKAGQVCYIEVLHEQEQGISGLSVAWSGPGFDREQIKSSQVPFTPTSSTDWSKLPIGTFVREIWDRTAIGDLSILSQTRDPCDEISLQDAQVIRTGPGKITAEPLDSAIKRHHTFSYCTAEGTVEDLSMGADGLQFQLVSDDQRYMVRINSAISPQDIRQLEHTRVRMSGVYKPLSAFQNREPSVELLVASTNQIERLGFDASWDDLPVLTFNEAGTSSHEAEGGRRKIRGRVLSYAADGSYSMRDQGYFLAYVSKDGNAWTQLGSQMPMALNDIIYAGFSLAPHTAAAAAEAVFDQTVGLTEPLEDVHVGGGLKGGGVKRAGSKITLTGYGGDTWDSFDDFHFLSTRINDERELITRIDKFSAPHFDGKAGLMMREFLSTRSAFTEVVYQDKTVRWISRNSDPGSRATVQGSVPASLPVWVKLKRAFHTIVVHPGPSTRPKIGAEVEVAGYPIFRANSLELDNALARELVGGVRSDAFAPVQPLVSIGQIANAPNDKRPNALRLRGVVTYSGVYRDHYYLSVQDDTGAVFISDDNDPDFYHPRVGQVVDVYGAPVFALIRDDLNVTKIVPMEEGALPLPVHHPAELLFSGNGAAYWTEVEGVVYNVDHTGTALLRCNSGIISVAIQGEGSDFWKNYIDCLVRVRGVIAYPSPTTPCLLVPGPGYLKAMDPVPRLSSNIPIVALHDLNTDTFLTSDKHRLRISGIVTFADSRTVALQDQNVGLIVQLAQRSSVAIGDNAIAIGFPSANGAMTLLESEVRSSGKASAIVPKSIGMDGVRSGELDGVLVKISGFLSRETSSEVGQVLEIEGNSGSAAAILTRNSHISNIPLGSHVTVTGVCMPVETAALSERGSVGSERFARAVFLRNDQDFVVLEHPGWWRLKRAAEVIAVLIVLLLTLFGWIHILRSRVRQRTEQLVFTMAQLKKETEVSTLLAERNRLAGEIHDSTEQGFSAALLQLDVATRLKSATDEIRKSLAVAKTMLLFSRSELRNAVWDLYSPELEKTDLPSALRYIIAQFESDVLALELEVTGEVRKLAHGTEHHLLRIAQEAITNAVKHANATKIIVTLKYTSDGLELGVSDNGRGFSFERVLSAREGHFGLRNLKTRAKKISAHIDITSEPGLGSNVKLRVPAKS